MFSYRPLHDPSRIRKKMIFSSSSLSLTLSISLSLSLDLSSMVIFFLIQEEEREACNACFLVASSFFFPPPLSTYGRLAPHSSFIFSHTIPFISSSRPPPHYPPRPNTSTSPTKPIHRKERRKHATTGERLYTDRDDALSPHQEVIEEDDTRRTRRVGDRHRHIRRHRILHQRASS